MRTKSIKAFRLLTKFSSRSSRTCRSPLTTSQQIFVLHENCPEKNPIFLPTMRWNPVPFDRLVKDMSSFRLKKNHDDLNNTRSGNYGFVKLKNHENARNRENVLSPYALWGLAGLRWQRRRTSCVRRLSSFDDHQAMYEASCRYTGFSLVSMTTKHAQ